MTYSRMRLTSALRGALALSITACAPESLVDVPAPSTVADPRAVTTAAGAVQLYNTAVSDFAIAFGGGISGAFVGANYIGQTGIFTDELQSSVTNFDSRAGIDERTAGTPGTTGAGQYASLYRALHHTRVTPAQARQALRLYAPASPKAWQGQLLAYEAFAIVWLAETFCSGIPLTTVPLVGVAALTRGFTTNEMFEQAIVLFDSAITEGADTTRFVNLARIGKARALLGLGRFSEAATAVQGIATDFTYTVRYAPLGGTGHFSLYPTGNAFGTNPTIAQVVDNEGGAPIAWSTDPRTGVMTSSSIPGMLVPAKYAVTSGSLDPETPAPSTPIRLADGLEARLIEAEADLKAGGSSWLTTLNTLRATCVASAPCAPVPGLTASSLPALADPGTSNARLDLLMNERALWLYLTGHRQGDLRRLARVYSRGPATLWPTGIYQNPGFQPQIAQPSTHGSPYGTDVVFTPADDEKTGNPLYSGCYDRKP